MGSNDRPIKTNTISVSLTVYTNDYTIFQGYKQVHETNHVDGESTEVWIS